MRIKNGFVIEKVGASYLAVATGERASEFNALIRLNGTGAFLWTLLTEQDRTEEELLELMLAEYDVDRDIAKRDIEMFKNQLLKGGLLDA